MLNYFLQIQFLLALTPYWINRFVWSRVGLGDPKDLEKP